MGGVVPRSPHAGRVPRVDRRRFRLALRRARAWYAHDLAYVTDGWPLDVAGRRAVARALRGWDVRVAAAPPVLRSMVYAPIVVMAIACLVLPPLAVGTAARAQLAQPHLGVAVGLYLVWFGALCRCYFGWQAPPILRTVLVRLSWAGATVGLLGAGIAAVRVMATDAGRLLLAARFSLIAAGIAAVLIAIMHVLVDSVWRVLMTVWLRRGGTLPPSLIVAVRIGFALGRFNQLQTAWRQESTRHRLTARLSSVASLIEQQVPWLVRLNGLGPHAHAETTRRCRHAAAVIRSMQWDIVDAHSRAQFDDVRRRLAGAATAAATGDWTPLTYPTEPPRMSRLARLGRRLLTPAVLVTIAALLPRLPGTTVADPVLTSLRVGLLTAAALSLLTVDGTAQERVLGALRSAGG